jgi:proteasome accessory factor C
MLPWLMERGEVPVAEAAERFGLSEAHLIHDLEVASMCGLPPYVDELVDLWIDDRVIHIGVPRLFTRPLRLTAPEGFALLAAGRAAMALPGADPAGALGRALEKLAATLGVTDQPAVVVEMERPPLLDVVQRAAQDAERLAISYYSAGRGERRDRAIDPQTVYTLRGRWYVVADDSLAGPARTFRVDRIESATTTGERFEHRAVAIERGEFFSDADTVEVTLLAGGGGVFRDLSRARVDPDAGRAVASAAGGGQRAMAGRCCSGPGRRRGGGTGGVARSGAGGRR